MTSNRKDISFDFFDRRKVPWIKVFRWSNTIPRPLSPPKKNTHKLATEPCICNYRRFKVPSDRSCFWSDWIGGALPTRDPDLAFPYWDRRARRAHLKIPVMPCDTNIARIAIIKKVGEKKVHDDRWKGKASGMWLFIEMMGQVKNQRKWKLFRRNPLLIGERGKRTGVRARWDEMWYKGLPRPSPSAESVS